jgi:HEAT repeat protein
MAVRKWAVRCACGTFLAIAAGGGYVALNWTQFRTEAAAKQLLAAESEEDRNRAATMLVASGDVARPAMLAVFRSPSEPACESLAAALAERSAEFVGEASGLSPQGIAAILKNLPTDANPAAVELVRAGIRSEHEAANIQAIRAALRVAPETLPEAKPLLASRFAGVRAAAVLALGTGTIVTDEELFRMMHDPEASVRVRVDAALKARGRNSGEVQYGVWLVSPNVADRLRLLNELRFADENLRDISPWLERLAADMDPAVRAGAARVAVECQLPFTIWLGKLATDDPDPAVRRVAGFYRERRSDAGVAPAGYRR